MKRDEIKKMSRRYVAKKVSAVYRYIQRRSDSAKQEVAQLQDQRAKAALLGKRKAYVEVLSLLRNQCPEFLQPGVLPSDEAE